VVDAEDGLSLDRLTDLIGLDGVTSLSLTWGGRRLYIPHRVSVRHPLAIALGLERAEALAAALGGDRLLDVPVGLGRIAAIHQLKRQFNSISNAEIAHRLRVSRRTVIRALQKRPVLVALSPLTLSDRGRAQGVQLDLMDWLGAPPAV
jgi:hypothetical protein